MSDVTNEARSQVLLRAQGRCECRLRGCSHTFDPREAYVGVIRRSRCVGELEAGDAGWEVDHRRPVLAGGSDDLYNLHLLCESCHGFKTALDQRRYGERDGLA